jgi:hypothetical protein
MTTTAILDLGELRGEYTLEIFDIKGQLMRPGRSLSGAEGSVLEIERGELSSGQYLLRLSNEEDSLELPFVVE